MRRPWAPIVVVAVLLLASMPLATVWNMVLLPQSPWRADIRPLVGVTSPGPAVNWTFRDFVDGKLRDAVRLAVTDSVAWRSLLIRLNNQLQFTLFSKSSNPGIFIGAGSSLHGINNIKEYCLRDFAVFRPIALTRVAMLKAIQDKVESQGRRFLYLITPNKSAAHPSEFLGLYDCRASAAEREAFLDRYIDLLRSAEIKYLDIASRIHGELAARERSLFPRGGVHWNELGSALAGRDLVSRLGQMTGQELPEVSWTTSWDHQPTGNDRDLLELLNLLFPADKYLVPHLTYVRDETRPCTRPMRAAVVGGSFVWPLMAHMQRTGCITSDFFFYLVISQTRYSAASAAGENVAKVDHRAIEEADVVVLEENEQNLGKSNHAPALARTLKVDD